MKVLNTVLLQVRRWPHMQQRQQRRCMGRMALQSVDCMDMQLRRMQSNFLLQFWNWHSGGLVLVWLWLCTCAVLFASKLGALSVAIFLVLQQFIYSVVSLHHLHDDSRDSNSVPHGHCYAHDGSGRGRNRKS